MNPTHGPRLDTWKVIAAYLGCSVRTVTRWAVERGLPIHHVPGGKRGTVFAFTDELDAWSLSREFKRPESRAAQPESFRCELPGGKTQAVLVTQAAQPFDRRGMSQFLASRWRSVLAVGIVLAVAFSISLAIRPSSSHASQLFSLKYELDTLEATDAEGHTLWTHRYPNVRLDNYFRTFPGDYTPVRVGDFFHDGKKEAAAIVPLRSEPNPSDIVHTQVDFFSGDGQLLWSYAPEKTLQFGIHKLKAPWAFLDLLVSQSNSQTTLWATASHHMWGNTFVAQLDPRTGHDELRFINTGVLYRLNELKTASATYLLAGGFNNEWDGGSLAIVNENRPFAASPQTPGTRHYCDSCPKGVPDYYFVFPRSEINRVSRIYEAPVLDIQISEDGIAVRKYERFAKGGENTVYLLSPRPPFTLLSLRYDSNYDMLHRQWSAEGKISHSLEDCPERLYPQPVRLWTPSKGWTDLPVKSAKADQ